MEGKSLTVPTVPATWQRLARKRYMLTEFTGHGTAVVCTRSDLSLSHVDYEGNSSMSDGAPL